MATVKQVLREADQIEASAKDQLAAWVILGQTEKYSAAMDRVAQLRASAKMGRADRNRVYQ